MNRELRTGMAFLTLGIFWAGSATAELNLAYLNRVTNYAGDITISGNYAYTAGDVSGTWIYDITDPVHPVAVGHTNNSGDGSSITVSGKYAYLANGLDGLRIYDVSDPTNPKNVGHSATNYGGRALDVAVSGNYAFVANYVDQVRVFDVSDPANPINVGHTVTNTGSFAVRGIAVSGNYVFVAADLNGLRVWDATDPTNLISVGYTNNGTISSVQLHGNYAYATGASGLHIYDISNPTNPLRVSVLNPSNGTFKHPLAFWGDHPFMVQSLGGSLRVYDIADPAHPILVASTNMSNMTYYGVAFSGNYILEAVAFDGIRAFSLTGPRLSITPSSADSVSVSWASPSTGFALQQNFDTSTSAWVDVTNTPVVASNRNQVVLQPSAGRTFFRLKLQ